MADEGSTRKYVISHIGRRAFVMPVLLLLSACGATVECRDREEAAPFTYVNGKQITGIGDPYLFTFQGKYYCTATEKSENFCIYRSEDLKSWENLGKILSLGDEGGWAGDYLWQPQIVAGKDGRFYLYYSGAVEGESLRIGVAAADTVEGPYRDVYGEPLFNFGYACIDPNLYIDEDGRMYLYYSRDCSENVIDGFHVSQIYVVEMEDYTHLKPESEPVLCLTPGQSWERPKGAEYLWNEGPDMLKKDGVYYLFYSGGYYGDRTYAIGYATGDSPLGPFTKYDGNPVLSSTKYVSGPGNNSFFHTLDGKELFTAYHTHTDPEKGGDDRKLNIDRCGFRRDGSFYIDGPTTSMQPQPSGTGGLKKVEGAFTVTASSTASGVPEAVLDGEFSVDSRRKKGEWCAEEGEGAYVTVDFGERRKVDCLFLYRAWEEADTPEEVRIHFSDGSRIEHIRFPQDCSEPVILSFDTVETEYVTVEASELGMAEGFALAEIGIYAYHR